MNTPTIIMVQIADCEWTMDALHRACRLGRTMPTHIALVKMIPVQHVSWLGTELGNRNYSEKDLHDIINYEATIEDYGIEFSSTVFQYSELAMKTGMALTMPQPASRICSTYHLVAISEPTGR